ncbi:MAG: M14 family zinc carboxypeptidase [Anaerolineae bacterium]
MSAQTSSSPPPPEKAVVVRIQFDTIDEVQTLAQTLDVWEVNHDEGYLIARTQPHQYVDLARAGYQYEIDAERSAHPDTIPDYPCYRTMDELYADLNTVVSNHSNITELITLGYSYEGRPIKVVRLTNREISGDKPRLFLMANTHGRELITSEAAMVFIDYLVDRYGTDADVTWLLDAHEIYVSVSTNPDGHVKNEPGEPWAWWRKNTHPYGSCSPDDYGVDLNRNHSFKWGCCGGSSDNECAETYRGPYLASESETQVVQDYVETLFPDQRGPGDYDPAPLDATGVLITLHSYSNLVLWPWGHTSTPAPNSDGLSTLGRKMASYNNYLPQQASGLYTVDGSTDDWSYGVLGIASYTFEIGSSGDGFYPPCSRYDDLIQPNIPALLYAAKVARTPYITSHGPDARSINATPDDVLGGWPIHLTTTINDEDNGENAIRRAEYYVDVPPWEGGTGISMTASDGVFESSVEAAEADIPTGGWTAGRHIIFVRGQDDTGSWGPPSAVFVNIQRDSLIRGRVSEADSGAPLADVQVVLDGARGHFSATTDIAGQYMAPVFSGTYTITARAFGYWPSTVEDVIAHTGMTTTQHLTLTEIPTGTLSGSVRELGTNLPLMAKLLVHDTALTTTTDLSGTYHIRLPMGVYTITATAPGHADRTLSGLTVTSQQTTTADVLLPTLPCLLRVDDDYGGTALPYHYEVYYDAALVAAGAHYETWDVKENGIPSAGKLGDYPAVLWFTGDTTYSTLSLGEQSVLGTYLNGGGHLFLTGQNIAADISGEPGDFLGTLLRASYVADDAGLTDLVGGGLYAGQTLSLVGGDGAGNQESPDVIAPLSDATPVFTYTGDGHGGLAVDTTAYRTLFMGFGVEGISQETHRRAVLERGLTWLGCPPAAIDLHIGLSGPTDPVRPGDDLTYTLTLTNSSVVPLTGLVVTDTLSPWVDVVSTSPEATVDGTDVRWSELTMAPEGMMSLNLVAQVQQGVPEGTVIHNADYRAQALQMSAPTVGAQGVSTPVTQTSVMELTVTPDHRVALPGTPVTYTVTLTNTGQVSDIFDVTLAGNVWPTEVVSDTVGPLAPGASASLTLTVTIPVDAGDGDSDTVTVTAALQDDPQESASVTLTTTAYVRRIYLPLVLRTAPAP